jgi:hypothetical protein
LSTRTRIYVETFQQYNPIRKNGGIWVGTKAFTSPNFAVASDAYNKYACIAYTDIDTNIVKYRILDNEIVIDQLQNVLNSTYDVNRLYANGNKLPIVDFADGTTVGTNGILSAGNSNAYL